MIVKFYDPHPGLLGCPEYLPGPVLHYAQSINGKKLHTEDVAKIIKELAGKGFVVNVWSDYITLETSPDMPYPHYFWRVIRFNEVKRKRNKIDPG